MFRRRTSVLLLGPIALLLIARTTPQTLLVGFPFVVFGQLIRFWSAGYLSKLSRLVTAGPFAYCRNPLYVGSFFLCTGYLIMSNRLDAFVVGTLLFWAFHGGAVSYEEKLLREKFSEDYSVYCGQVPRFLPLGRRTDRHGEFSIRQLMLNNEHWGFFGVVLMTLCFALIAYSHGNAPIMWLDSLW